MEPSRLGLVRLTPHPLNPPRRGSVTLGRVVNYHLPDGEGLDAAARILAWLPATGS
jgi:hypothetical protein